MKEMRRKRQALSKEECIEALKEERQAIETLALKYSPSESEESRTQEIERFWKTLCMLE